MADNFLTQVHFTGESSCMKFAPNPFRGNICVTCSKEIFKHKKTSIESKEVLMKVCDNMFLKYIHLSNTDISLSLIQTSLHDLSLIQTSLIFL